MSDLIVGIDPGATGAIAFYDEESNKVDVFDLPMIGKLVDGYALGSYMRDENIKRVNVEKVGAMKGQGVTSMFNFGANYGAILGVCGCLGLSVNLVTPQKWKKKAGLIKKEKDASRQLAKTMFPLAPLDLKKHHGRADAILIAVYGGDFL